MSFIAFCTFEASNSFSSTCRGAIEDMNMDLRSYLAALILLGMHVQQLFFKHTLLTLSVNLSSAEASSAASLPFFSSMLFPVSVDIPGVLACFQSFSSLLGVGD